MTEPRLDGDIEEGESIEPESVDGRLQIGLTEDGRRRIKLLREDLGWFDKDRDAGRFALAYAVRQGVEPSDPGAVRTAWHLSSFDNTGEIKPSLALCTRARQHPSA